MSEEKTEIVDGAFGSKVEVQDDGNGRKVFRVAEVVRKPREWKGGPTR